MALTVHRTTHPTSRPAPHPASRSAARRHVSRAARPATSLAERTGSVSVLAWGVARNGASCSCGWTGPQRVLRAAAAQDAWTHALRSGCAVSSPLVYRW